jgi:hypothetical protein
LKGFKGFGFKGLEFLGFRRGPTEGWEGEEQEVDDARIGGPWPKTAHSAADGTGPLRPRRKEKVQLPT